jgi:hypothetical protein
LLPSWQQHFCPLSKSGQTYLANGRLFHPIAILLVTYFCVHALAYYALLDSRLSKIKTVGLLLVDNQMMKS